MFNLYIAVILTALLLLLITITDVETNRLITGKMKRRTVIVCLMIAGAALGECIGVLTNGTAAALLIPHKIAKLMEFCFAPASGVAAALAYGVVKKPAIPVFAAAAHAAFECIALRFDWVFRIDAQNVYHRSELYFIYVAVFVASVAYCFFCVIRSGKEYQTDIDGVLILTLLMLFAGIGIQFVCPDIRIDFLCIAIVNTLLYNRFCKIVLQVDAVTRLLNRRCYDASVGNITSPAAVIFFDINRFKLVNDTYGHSVGDICLRHVADIMRSVYRKYGSCYRIGGDEFCVILHSHLDAVEALNEQFRAAIRSLREEDQRMPDVALGYAYYDAKTTHIQNVIEQADAMMYQNK